MSKASGKASTKNSQVPENEYELLRQKRIEANNTKMTTLGVKRIAASMINVGGSTRKKMEVKRNKGKATLDRDSDYSPEDESSDDGIEKEAGVEERTRKEERQAHSKKFAKKKARRNYIQPNAMKSLVTQNKNLQGKGKKGGPNKLTTALKVLWKAIDSQQEEEEADNRMDLDKEIEKQLPEGCEETDEADEEFQRQERDGMKTRASSSVSDKQAGMMESQGDNMQTGEINASEETGKGKAKKTYKTKTPRGPTRNLQLAKMKPGEKIKVDFDVSGQPVGVNRAKLSSYCGSIVRDPLNAPLYHIQEFKEVPEENKEKMWKLILDKFDIGMDDVRDEEEREQRRKDRRKFIMTSLNKKYRNIRARLKRLHYDTEENDEDRLKEENRPPGVDEKDWEWLVEYFGTPDFQKRSLRNIENRSYLDAGHTAGTKSFAQKAQDMYERNMVMPGLLELYEETHTRSDKTPITETARATMDEIKQLVGQRTTSEIKMTDEEIYAAVKPKRKPTARERKKGISPSLTALFGSFNEGEKFRREAEAAKQEANEAKKEANEASAENKTLKTTVEQLEKKNKVMLRALEAFMNLAGYDLSELDMDKLMNEDIEDEADEESDATRDEEEGSGEE